VFRERLRVPAWWWLTPIFFVLVFTAGAYRYSGVPASVVTAVLCVIGVVVGLLRYGALELLVEAERFRAGRLTLPYSVMGPVAPLDAGQAHALRGPRADARARLVLRGYVAAAVRIDVLDPLDPAPYWYVSTRRPHELAAALNAARERARGGEHRPAQ
jgi:hypothetical protein